MLHLICTLQILSGRLRDRLSQPSSDERGASTVEWVIITGILIALAAVAGRAVYAMVSEASSNLQVPTVP
ncbi:MULTISPECIES: hypothetical protein [Actinomyces]|uniref:DUF4244 domain-containing protein n=2 Tax=Actinomyces TaxID=1654 RepID=A0A853EJH0_9ACTO|nr:MULTISPECIES: hypothetical protein [Actinomyces]MBF0695813.1 hypothetical protein [Actinomyces bowdenii]MCR2053716.1 hypothetical protein [Actinomyces bowdenii]MDO5064555.1 hypothetical protein [Actinomyces bowdenii]NYS67986.1 hypothetical protein [Actinomyces bowdenii]BDA64987.1 hypothetical protein MANAM107_18210 [Actinomyces capricornis]